MGAIGSATVGVTGAVAARRPEPPGVKAAHVVFPGLVVAMVVGNQGWAIGGLYLGQMISWLVDLAALAIVAHEFRGRLWPYVLAAAIIGTRVSGSGWVGSGWVDTAYTLLLNVLFGIAGIVVARRHAGWVLNQVRWICLWSTVFMALQVPGVGEWTQFLATENEGRPKTAQKTLFVESQDLSFQTVQARPSGLLHSNNFLSGVVLFALGLQLSNRRRRRLSRWDILLGLMAVLSMAKIVFVVTALMVLWLLVLGTSGQRARMRRFVVVLVVLLMAYRWLFPGLWVTNLSSEQFAYSFYIRVNDLVDRLSPDNPIRAGLAPYLEDTYRLTAYDVGQGLSGYAHLVKYLPLAVVGVAMFFPLFFFGWLRLRHGDPPLSSSALLLSIFVVLYPGAVPLLSAQIFWFMAGFALLPLAMLVMPSLRYRPRPSRPLSSSLPALPCVE